MDNHYKIKKMKTKILSLSIIMMMVLGSVKTTIAATFKDEPFTVLNNVSAINKIEVYGNVELYVSDATFDRVKVYNKYYSESALVQNKNGVLRIASYKAEKLVVWVSANDLRSIAVFDNSVVKTFGAISKIDFGIELHNNASASVNLNTYFAKVTVRDMAKVELKGSAEELSLDNGIQSNVNGTDFKATKVVESTVPVTASIGDEIISL
jgi:hypothetical protein